jgi:3',5'-cyclic AMP phosphodiesterase CpdA
MRKIVHLSDLHFGRVDYALIGPLSDAIAGIGPDLIVVSGDLTQRARTREFIEARLFLDSLPKPQIIVPGNHDVPMHNVYARFLQPLTRYRRHITDETEPFYLDDEIAVMGINTARSLTTKHGRINQKQVSRISELLCPLANNIRKIIVTHHPFDRPEGHEHKSVVGGAKKAMEAIAGCGADVILTGHLHVGFTGHTARRYRIAGHSALMVQAGTAISTRGRGESNSFNLIKLQDQEIKVGRYDWLPGESSFSLSSSEDFIQTADGWVRG